MKKKTRDFVVRTRCNEQEMKAFKLVARDEAMKTSELLRLLIRNAARERGYWPPMDNPTPTSDAP